MSDDERIEPDYDEPITGEQLAAWYDAIFRPVPCDEVELAFDPDDYPVL